MPKQVNYSVEMTDKIISEYQSGISVDEIANAIGKSVRSVRSKLVREGVYIAQEKAKSNKPKEPTKKELLRVLESQVDFPVEGLLGATKESILDLIKFSEK